ncbi:DeoR/GlpR family DNA-binding transcription regulator [Halomonas sp. H5]|uniref:DeoR/GlpR family DNA-binding transcription regulator n=1 Tax=Halomonas sp. H5 TaxID=3423910 RepID=UPI003D35C998
MSKRNTAQRRHAILAFVNERGETGVDTLAEHFAISEVTVRKDLATLEKSGLLLRRYGGAAPLPQELLGEPRLSPAKRAIARAACGRIREHQRIIIDSGSTTSAMIPGLAGKAGLVVMTNALAVANALRELEEEPMLLMTGGTWDPHSESFQGQVAEQVLRQYDFDQLFIGADGIDPTRGTTLQRAAGPLPGHGGGLPGGGGAGGVLQGRPAHPQSGTALAGYPHPDYRPGAWG